MDTGRVVLLLAGLSQGENSDTDNAGVTTAGLSRLLWLRADAWIGGRVRMHFAYNPVR